MRSERSSIKTRTQPERRLGNIMRDPPCARQVAPDPIQSLLPLNPGLATLKGCVIWPAREEARPALRKAGRTFQFPARKEGATRLALARVRQKIRKTFIKSLREGGARQVALGSSPAQGRSHPRSTPGPIEPDTPPHPTHPPTHPVPPPHPQVHEYKVSSNCESLEV